MASTLSDEEIHELKEAARDNGPESLEARVNLDRQGLIGIALAGTRIRNQCRIVLRHADQMDSVLRAVLLRELESFERALAAWNPATAKILFTGEPARAGAVTHFTKDET